MSTQEQVIDLEQVIETAELSDEEAQLVRQMVESEELSPDEAVQAALATRDDDADDEQPTLAEAPASEPSDRQLKALDKEADRHIAAAHKIMGHFLEGFVGCEECGGLGLTPPGPQAKTHPFYTGCPTCNAFGKVKTGSLVEEHIGVNCPDCLGRGFLEAMADNETAVELVERLRQQKRLLEPSVEQPVAPPQLEQVPGELKMGRPAWLGDVSLGS